MVGDVFPDASAEGWDGAFYALETAEEVLAYCRHHHLPAASAARVTPPVWLTKRGVLLRAVKP